MKLDLSYFMFMTNNDYRVLTGIEMGMKNHEYVPTSLISSLSNLRREGINRVLKTLLQNKLIVHKNVKYDGYKLTYLGYDYLALKAFTKRGSVKSVGMQIGVGKESDIFICKDNNGELKCLKIHRLGRVSFRTIKNKRDYYGKKTFRNWLYLSKIAATKEYAYLKALFENNFPVPVPFDLNRHMIVMSYVNGFPLAVARLRHPLKVIDDLINTLLKFAKADIIHGDFNEFNILIDDNEKVTVIDFPQIVSLQHENAAMYFNRDMQCIVEYFCKKYRIDIVDYPTYEDVININSRRLIPDEEHITKNEDSLLLSVLQRDNSCDEFDENDEETIQCEYDQEREGKEKKREKDQEEEGTYEYKINEHCNHYDGDDDDDDDDEEFNSCNESVTCDLGGQSEEEQTPGRILADFKEEKAQKKEKQKEEMQQKVNDISDTTEDETSSKKENTNIKNYSADVNTTEKKTRGRYAKEKYIKESLKREDIKEEMKKEKQYDSFFFENEYKLSEEKGLNNMEKEYKNKLEVSSNECSVKEHRKKEALNHHVLNEKMLDSSEAVEMRYEEEENSNEEHASVCNGYEDSANSIYEEMEISSKELRSNDIRQFQNNSQHDSTVNTSHFEWEYVNDADNGSICSSEIFIGGAQAEDEIEYEIQDEIEDREDEISNGENKIDAEKCEIEDRDDEIENGENKMDDEECEIEEREDEIENRESIIDDGEYVLEDRDDEIEDNNKLKEEEKQKTKKKKQGKCEKSQKKNVKGKIKHENMYEDEKKNKKKKCAKKNKIVEKEKASEKDEYWEDENGEVEEEKCDEDWNKEIENFNSTTASFSEEGSHYSSCNSSDCEEIDVPNKLSGTWTPHIRKYTKEYVRNKIKYMNKKKSCKEKYKNSLKTKTKNAAMEKIKGYL